MGDTILSPQYLEKYWGECSHCLYCVGAYGLWNSFFSLKALVKFDRSYPDGAPNTGGAG